MKTVDITSKSITRIAVGLCLAGTVLALSASADARIAGNSRQSNKLAANRLPGNRLSGNTLATNRLAGDGAFTDIAAIELPNGMRLAR